ncbi:ribosome maturation factor RimP [Meiothermus sp. QL-1]|uniref:ribosome maturation factor RimP n=1 Tax=Meiothermus sp. QL-1 TaxID=2058095 RepID=UPI000E0C9946|nr:ribosome maturation factor RimP [Meiothermus sp. QL-1]RDI95601.1 ribosome maturation factor RimP [Meiothermus sp. QL-1]
MAQKALAPLGYDVLEAGLRTAGRSKVFLVRIERRDEAPVSVGDLERASQALSSLLDQHDPIQGRYLLQVESPGPERPLLTARHFERFMGLRVRVRTPEGPFTARIKGVAGDEVELELENREIRKLRLNSFKANLAEWPERPR